MRAYQMLITELVNVDHSKQRIVFSHWFWRRMANEMQPQDNVYLDHRGWHVCDMLTRVDHKQTEPFLFEGIQ